MAGRVQVSASQSRIVWPVPVGPEDAAGHSLGSADAVGVQEFPDHLTAGGDLEDAARRALCDQGVAVGQPLGPAREMSEERH